LFPLRCWTRAHQHTFSGQQFSVPDGLQVVRPVRASFGLLESLPQVCVTDSPGGLNVPVMHRLDPYILFRVTAIHRPKTGWGGGGSICRNVHQRIGLAACRTQELCGNVHPEV
jgi:hypothetical protein